MVWFASYLTASTGVSIYQLLLLVLLLVLDS